MRRCCGFRSATYSPRNGWADTMPSTIPLLEAKAFDAHSVFQPENLLREARRQKRLALEPVPSLCVLDPDGDIVRQLRATGRASRSEAWACYHTDLYVFDHDGARFGIVGCAVGAPFAVPRGRADVRLRLPPAGQHHLLRPDRTRHTDPHLRADRPGPARRGHQPPLPAAGNIAEADPALASPPSLRSCPAAASPCVAALPGPPTRRPRDRDGDRRRARPRRACRRDGGGRAVCLRPGPRQARPVLRPRSPTRWPRPTATSRKVRRTAPMTRWPSFPWPPRRGGQCRERPAEPIQDMYGFLTDPVWTTWMFWVLLVGTCVVAVLACAVIPCSGPRGAPAFGWPAS